MTDRAGIVRAAYAAFAAGDIDAAVANLADDVVWVEPLQFPNGGRHLGRDAVHDYLQRSRAMWAQLTSSVVIHQIGDRLVAIHSVHGRLADGSEHSNTVGDVFTFDAGQVVEMTAYVDAQEALAAAHALTDGE